MDHLLPARILIALVGFLPLGVVVLKTRRFRSALFVFAVLLNEE